MTIYKNAIELTKNKDKAMDFLTQHTLIKTVGLFTWAGLPETIPPKRLEKIVQKNGYALIIVKDGELYAVEGQPQGMKDINGEYHKYSYNTPDGMQHTVENPVVIFNDSLSLGMLPIIEKYGALIVDSEISLQIINILNRCPQLMTASDKDSKTSAEQFINKIIDGDYSVIADSQFFEGIKSHQGTTSDVLQAIELNKYYTARLNQLLGIDSNDNFKRERLVSAEIQQNKTGVEFYIMDLLENRKRACEELNARYQLNVSVERRDNNVETIGLSERGERGEVLPGN